MGGVIKADDGSLRFIIDLRCNRCGAENDWTLLGQSYNASQDGRTVILRAKFRCNKCGEMIRIGGDFYPAEDADDSGLDLPEGV